MGGKLLLPRLSLRAKLLASFVLVLLPVLGLLLYGYREANERRIDTLLDTQMQTARAVASLVDANFNEAVTLAWALANDPIVQTFDPSRLDPYLERLVSFYPQYYSINLINAEGDRVAGSRPLDAGFRPERLVADRPYFQQVMATGKPVISEVLIGRTVPPLVSVIVAVPLRDETGNTIGAVLVALYLDALARGLEGMALGPEQHILLVDRRAKAAFYTALPEIVWEQRNVGDFEPVKAALEGNAIGLRRFTSPLLNDMRIGAFSPSPKYGWVVGVSEREDVALAPMRTALRDQLLGLGVIVILSLALVLLASRALLRPIARLTSHALALGRGDLQQRATIKTGDELEELGRTFNQMAEQIMRQQENIQAQNEELRIQNEELGELDRLKDEFISIAAHELKTPLAIMKGYSQALLRRPDELALHEIRRVLAAIDRGSDRITNVVQDLLDISKLHAGKLELTVEPVDLPAMVAAIVDRAGLTTEKHRIRLVKADPVVVQGDRDRLEQVVAHLIDNAAKYSPNGGDIDVAVVLAHAEAVVSVTDCGVGIPKDKQARIFQRFYSAHTNTPYDYGGMGVGLYISKEIVERHGGRMCFESEEGKGSTFSFSLPLARSVPN